MAVTSGDTHTARDSAKHTTFPSRNPFILVQFF
jgi:hypothetical protein